MIVQMKLKLYIIAFFLTSFTWAQVNFEAKVSKSSLGVNQRLRVEFVMNKDGDNFIPPTFENFTVIGGPNQSISTFWANGKRSFSKTFSYVLAPKKQGRFNITQATIEIDGQTYKTSPIEIYVTKAVEIPKDPNDPNYLASQNVHLVAEVSKSNPYLNEAITVVYKLYISDRVGLSSNWDYLETPTYNDFWSQDIEIKELRTEKGSYLGDDNYRFVVLKKTVLYPQKIGELEIEPLVLSVGVSVPTSRRDIFGNLISQTAQRTISAGKRVLNVKSLPEDGKPLGFTGAVGDFELKVTTNKTELKATEALQAKIEVSGRGNLKLFELPNLQLPASLEVYEPEHKENVRTNLAGMRGSISDEYTIVPSQQGKYPIPVVDFSYFDIKAKRYKTLSSNEVVINVGAGPLGNTTTIAANTPITNSKQSVIATGSQFASFKTNTNFIAIKPKVFFKTTLFWTLLLIPFLMIPLAIFIKHKKDERDGDVAGNKIRKANRLARKYLGEAKRSLGQKEAFYDAMERALHNYLKYKLSIETSEFSKDKITQLLSERNVQDITVNDFNGLLQSCELARYTPFTNVEMQQDYDKAASVISTIDKQIR